MKGTIVEFLKLAGDNSELAKDLVGLAAKYDFQFSDEVSDDELDGVAGGFSMVPLFETFKSAISAVNSDQEAMLSKLADMNDVAAAQGEYLKDLNDSLDLSPPSKG